MMNKIKVNIPKLIPHSMLEPREQLVFPCLLTEVFEYCRVDLSTETPSLCKQGIGSTTLSRIFMPGDDMAKILNEESFEEARLKKYYMVRLQVGRRD